MNSQVVLRIVTAAAAHFINLRMMACDHELDARADTATVRFGSNGPNCNPIVVSRRIAAQQLRVRVDWVDHDVSVAVIIEISECAASAGVRFHKRPANLFSDVFKTPIAQVAVENLALTVSDLPFQLINFGINVAVNQEDVEPAIILKVKETAPPT